MPRWDGKSHLLLYSSGDPSPCPLNSPGSGAGQEVCSGPTAGLPLSVALRWGDLWSLPPPHPVAEAVLPSGETWPPYSGKSTPRSQLPLESGLPFSTTSYMAAHLPAEPMAANVTTLCLMTVASSSHTQRPRGQQAASAHLGTAVSSTVMPVHASTASLSDCQGLKSFSKILQGRLSVPGRRRLPKDQCGCPPSAGLCPTQFTEPKEKPFMLDVALLQITRNWKTSWAVGRWKECTHQFLFHWAKGNA